MTNFIFKSQGTYKKLVIKLEIIQSELRHQRVDMAHVLMLLEKMATDHRLQHQVDEYFNETSPQTDSVEQDANN